MHRIVSISSVFFAVLVLLGCDISAVDAKGFDEGKLIEHIHATYQIPPTVGISLGSPKSSDIPGFKSVELTMRFGGQSKTDTLYISDNGRHYIMGGFKDLSIHPYKERMKKIDVESSAYRGPKDAPVQVVEYTDFQCPFCHRGYKIMADQIMQEYRGKVRWVYKSLPLKSIHPWAEPAAIAVECAKGQSMDKFWAMHDTLFDEQRQITNGNYEEKFQKIAKASKLNMKKFDACYDAKKTLGQVSKDMAEATAVGISGTPAFVVNGRLIPGADAGTIKRSVEEALSETKK
jgi:protein-disulfide isomerase